MNLHWLFTGKDATILGAQDGQNATGAFAEAVNLFQSAAKSFGQATKQMGRLLGDHA